MKKKIVIVLLACVILVGGIGGAVAGAQSYQKSKLVAEVESVAMLNWGYYESSMESEGIVANDASQSVYVDSSQIINQIYVTEGQTVKAGDPLMEYDITSLRLSIEIKKLGIQTLNNQIAANQKELERLKKVKPVTPTIETPVIEEPVSEPQIPEYILPALQKIGDAYNYISEEAVPYNESASTEDGSAEDGSSAERPVRYLCTEDGFVMGSFLSDVIDRGMAEPYWVCIEVREGNRTDGDLISSWTMSSETLSYVEDPDSRWSVMERYQIQDEIPEPEEPEEEPVVEPAQPESTETVYTPEELTKAIQEKERTLKGLDLDKRKEELALSQMESQTADGIVYAALDGTVKTLGDPENIPNDGSAFLVVSGSDGLYVKGNVNELLLEHIQVGQLVTATSWDTGNYYEATITSIDAYPADNNFYYGDGNPNASYYGYTAYIEEPDGLTGGEYLALSIATDTEGDSMDSIYLESSYVREEDGRSYVMKDDGGVLVKQYVTTGKMISGGYGIEITSGLTQEDYITFPYGKTAQEGVTTNSPDNE